MDRKQNEQSSFESKIKEKIAQQKFNKLNGQTVESEFMKKLREMIGKRVNIKVIRDKDGRATTESL